MIRSVFKSLMLRRSFGLTAFLTILSPVSVSTPALAWDPSSTHLGITDAAVTRSQVHLRLMEASELQQGIFSDLRVDPTTLKEHEARLIAQLQVRSHADSGSRLMGGPGSCPAMDAPIETQQRCVKGDLWQGSALVWLRLGLLAELLPSARESHHFLQRDDATSLRWSDTRIPAIELRSIQSSSNGAPLAGDFTGSNFSGKGMSAVGWLESSDALAPSAIFENLRHASLAEDSLNREQHLALALFYTGALIHVLQDLSVPAHARGDMVAFLSPLSRQIDDRGLPLQEFTRAHYGRAIVANLVLPAPPLEGSLSPSIRGHFVGDEDYQGLGPFTASYFFSEASLPPAIYIDPKLSPQEAAQRLLGEKHGLQPSVVADASLSPWPASRGYLKSSSGRPLAAFDTNSDQLIRPFLDEYIYRDQIEQLLPVALRTTQSLLNLIWPKWPTMEVSTNAITLDVPEDLSGGTLHLLTQSATGDRRPVKSYPLRPGEKLEIKDLPTLTKTDARLVLVLDAQVKGGSPRIGEMLLAIPSAAQDKNESGINKNLEVRPMESPLPAAAETSNETSPPAAKESEVQTPKVTEKTP